MTRHELTELYDRLVRLEAELRQARAPGAMISKAHAARLSVSWLMDHRG